MNASQHFLKRLSAGVVIVYNNYKCMCIIFIKKEKCGNLKFYHTEGHLKERNNHYWLGETVQTG